MDLTPGRIRTSPRAAGLTGAGSWFWLEPQLGPRTLSITLAAETVTVAADPSVEWRFGDGSSRQGGAGRAYQAGPPPADAIVHVYETRCLRGDRGRNPYVLVNCGDGYRVEAVVSWRLSFRAVGPIDAGGAIPTRTTETGLDYPVTEARAFLSVGVSP
jgi:hypothetical protein